LNIRELLVREKRRPWSGLRLRAWERLAAALYASGSEYRNLKTSKLKKWNIRAGRINDVQHRRGSCRDGLPLATYIALQMALAFNVSSEPGSAT